MLKVFADLVDVEIYKTELSWVYSVILARPSVVEIMMYYVINLDKTYSWTHHMQRQRLWQVSADIKSVCNTNVRKLVYKAL